MGAYLDHNATTPMVAAAHEALSRAAEECWGNPSSVHREGQRARFLVEEARAEVAALLDAESSEVIFTGSGTEADNLALRGVLESRPGAHLVIGGIEHEAVAECALLLGRRGHSLTVVPPGPGGRVETGALLAALRPDTALVSLIHASNLLGTLQPVAELAAACHERGVLVHSDAVQTAGRVPVSFRALGVDLLSVSAHKMGGAPGAGALLLRRGIEIEPLLSGGGQEFRRRSGTEAVPALAAFGAAARDASRSMGRWARTASLRDRLEEGLARELPEVRVLGAGERRLPNTSALLLPGLSADDLVLALDLRGFSVSAGSACHSGAPAPPPALKALGLGPDEARGVLRVSLGPETRSEEVEGFLAALATAAAVASGEGGAGR
jgi:cysteine desulfurase